MSRLPWGRIGLHILFWMAYLPLNAVLTCILYRYDIQEAFWEMVRGEAYALPAKMALTYFVFYYIIPLYLERSKTWKLVGALLSAFAITIVLYRIIFIDIYVAIYAPDKHFDLFDPKGLYLTAFDIFVTVAAASTVKLIRMHYSDRELAQQLLSEKLQSELNFLRAQTNPHFLFNTLNNLYVLAWKKNERTADAIMMLSKIMRFLLYDCRAPRVRVADEAKVIGDYIELEKLRYNERLSVSYEENLDDPSTPLAPLLLLPFVENSFKHGANGTTGEASIGIRLLLENRNLNFFVENTDADKDASPAPNGGVNGIGLKNVRRQLDLLYPDRHQLKVERNDGIFKIHLSILLPEEE